ncbi:hypothetical protein GW765_04115 [Candidatus Parcubacteria bacterium]|nr:hypothetical protein [Candidatus Parcubacteria bacterium]
MGLENINNQKMEGLDIKTKSMRALLDDAKMAIKQNGIPEGNMQTRGTSGWFEKKLQMVEEAFAVVEGEKSKEYLTEKYRHIEDINEELEKLGLKSSKDYTPESF